MDFSRYEKLRTLVRANFSEQTRALVDEALEYADGKLAGLAVSYTHLTLPTTPYV